MCPVISLAVLFSIVQQTTAYFLVMSFFKAALDVPT